MRQKTRCRPFVCLEKFIIFGYNKFKDKISGGIAVAVLIKAVTKNSHGEKHGILSGEYLVSINGNEIMDVLDYRFYQINRELNLEIRSQSGETRNVTIKKPEYDEIGFEFETYLMDKQRSCRNKCIFCFIDQLPKGMRESLYFKDDDSRLSFLFGNYVTLTNLTEHEISRIIKMHISPINVSVHTTNPELRVKMMGNRFAGESLSILKCLADAGIQLNCQIVACPGINDGEELVRTLTDLEKLNVNMTAVVPVGLTDYREGLFELTPYNPKTAGETLDIIESFGDRCVEKYGRRIFYAADELYIKAGREIPPAEYYEDFPALDNGVGLIALLKDELSYAVEEYTETAENYKEEAAKVKGKVTIACGESVRPFLDDMLNVVRDVFENIQINVVAVKNKFFGGGVNVSGLVVGRDLIDTLKNVDIGDRLLIPSVMLRFDGEVFLDDTTLEDVERELCVPVFPVNNGGQDLLDAVISSGRSD